MDKETTAPPHAAHRLGAVIEVSGLRLSCELVGEQDGGGTFNQVQIGDVIRIPTPTTVAFGFVDHIGFESAPSGRGPARAEIDLLGELKSAGGKKEPVFVRGVTVYPVLGAAMYRATEDDMVRIYGRPGAATLAIGSLHQFPDKTAYLKSEVFFSKNSAIVGTTGAGKSCALALILRTALKAHPQVKAVFAPYDELTKGTVSLALAHRGLPRIPRGEIRLDPFQFTHGAHALDP